ncbi:hypothetical protein BGZ68_002674 [Mortierella alpina]|nr:hypothetical protein BGZ68_002674 [Mortierella alpina]
MTDTISATGATAEDDHHGSNKNDKGEHSSSRDNGKDKSHRSGQDGKGDKGAIGSKDDESDKANGRDKDNKDGAEDKDRGDIDKEHPATDENGDLGDDNSSKDDKEGNTEGNNGENAEENKEGDAGDNKEGDAEDNKEGDAENNNRDGSESHNEEDGGDRQDETDGSKNDEGTGGEDHSSVDGDKDHLGQGDRGNQSPDTGGSKGEGPGLDAPPGAQPGTGSDNTPTDPQTKVPSPANQDIPGTNPFFTDSGSSLPIAPSVPMPGNSNTSQVVSTKPASTPADKESGTKIITYTLIPLTVIAAVAYGVIAYRRRTTRRRALRRRLQEDAEAAAIAASRPPGGEDDDAASVMSEISYRPPAPYTSEVDITTESMENNPEVVTGDTAPHLISAPKRDEARVGDYQDYSHVCQAQMMGKTCTNHSISCFVALNHSNAGLASSAAPRNPSTASSRALGPLDQMVLPETPKPCQIAS